MNGAVAKMVFVSLIVVNLSACDRHSHVTSAQDEAIVRARRTVSEDLRDPQSAQFRNERLVAKSKVVCGEMNGKNGYGGYVGFTPYIFDVSVGHAQISPGAPDFATLNSYNGSIASPIAKRNIDQVADACAFGIAWAEKCESRRPIHWGEYKKICEEYIVMRPKVDAIPNE